MCMLTKMSCLDQKFEYLSTGVSLTGPPGPLPAKIFEESQTQVCFLPQYHQCQAKNHFANNWVYRILTSFGIEFIFIGLTSLLIIFQIIKFKFIGQVSVFSFVQKIMRGTLSYNVSQMRNTNLAHENKFNSKRSQYLVNPIICVVIFGLTLMILW